MKYLIIIWISLFSSLSYGFEFKAPDYLSLQTGGYTGFATLGVGYKLNNIWDLETQMGYTPYSLGGIDITTFDLKVRWYHSKLILDDNMLLLGYFSSTFLYSNDKDMFVVLPAKYPRKYYDPSAIRWLFTFGSMFQIHDKYSFYIDYSYTDVELTKYYNNYEYLSLQNLGSIGLGIKYKIK